MILHDELKVFSAMGETMVWPVGMSGYSLYGSDSGGCVSSGAGRSPDDVV